ncbi:hypothetical protein GCM10022251_13330 [Phytohabitans flavus]|uniref:ABC transmembrane type-1 domain-containing protein n=1 Tax=Phytohabitans flavus TaxID=1076124 RepID=A0A6F8XJ57_9ACTN|nr:hypothetical protein Pflav_002520 [Phytohabitans flavus]
MALRPMWTVSVRSGERPSTGLIARCDQRVPYAAAEGGLAECGRDGSGSWRWNNVAGGQSIPFGQAMAGALLASLPTLAIYLLLGRFFLRGVLAGTLRDN